MLMLSTENEAAERKSSAFDRNEINTVKVEGAKSVHRISLRESRSGKELHLVSNV